MDFSLGKKDTAVLKGIAICAMLFHHLYAVPPSLYVNINFADCLRWIGELGKVCVAIFLFCSGYGLSAQYGMSSTFDTRFSIKLVVKRLLKFYVNYWAVFIVFVPITILVFNRPLSVPYGENVNFVKRFVFDIFGIQGFHSYNVTWWFNLLIIIFYLLSPLFYLFVKHGKVLAFVFGVLLLRFKNVIPGDFIDIYVWQLPFLMGMLWQNGEKNLQRVSSWLYRHRLWFSLLSVLLVMMLVCVRMFPILRFWGGTHVDAFLACSISFLVISTIRNLPRLSKVLAFFGKHSMNIYLIHAFVCRYWHPQWLYSSIWMSNGVNFAVLLGICLAMSMLLELIKEKGCVYLLLKKVLGQIDSYGSVRIKP